FHGMNESWIASLEYTRLNANSSADITDPATPGSSVSGKFDVPANGVTLGATYLFPSSRKARFGLGAGIGYYSASGKFEAEGSGGTFSDDVKGHGVGFHAMGVVDSPLSNTLHLDLGVGYRYAKSSNLEVAGVEALNADGSKAKIDWSGLMSRVGMTFYFGQK